MPEAPLLLVHVSGSVRDRDGAGLPDVRIDLFGHGPVPGYESSVTDSTGTFTIDLAEGTYDVIILPRTGIGLPNVRLERMAISAKAARVDYQYTGILVQGTVSLSGARIDSGYVIFEYWSGDYTTGIATDFRNGSFAILLPHPGTYEVRAISLVPPIPGSTRQEIAVTADTTIQISIDAFLISGTIFGPDGTALIGATISQERDSHYYYAKSGSDGGYQLWFRGEGGRLVVYPPSDMSFVLPRMTQFVTSSGPTTLDISLDGIRWRGAVRSSVDSTVVPSVSVTAYLVADAYRRYAKDVTDGNGGFELVLEPRNEYDLSVSISSGEHFITRGRFATSDSTFDIYVTPTGYGLP